MKVCGITREADIHLLAIHDIDAIGFIFHPASARRISISRARQLRKLVPPTMLVFGVVGEMDKDAYLQLALQVKLDVLQIHSRITVGVMRQIQSEGYRVASVFQPVTDLSWESSAADIIVFDNATKSETGGTGKVFDWKQVRKPYPENLMLAGGLNASNILAAIQTFRPALVDLNSGVESVPGEKSAKKLAAVLTKIRTKI